MKNSFLPSFHLSLSSACTLNPERLIKSACISDHKDWTYQPGGKTNFRVSVTQNEELIPNCKIKYEIGLEKNEPYEKRFYDIIQWIYNLEAGTLNASGFLRCIVTATIDGKDYRGLATAGYNPNDIKQTVSYP